MNEPKLDVEDIIYQNTKQYWEGPQNRLIRYYVYTMRGLNEVNNLKYLIGAIIALYAILHFGSPWMMLVVGLVCLPILTLLGRFHLHKIAKTGEWVNTHFGSVLGYRQYNLQVQQLEILEKILKKLDESPRK